MARMKHFLSTVPVVWYVELNDTAVFYKLINKVVVPEPTNHVSFNWEANAFCNPVRIIDCCLNSERMTRRNQN